MNEFPFKIMTTSFDPAQAELRLQYSGMDSFDLKEWSGTVIGPYCHDRQTIAISHPLSPAGDDSLTSRIPEPCYWSPSSPLLYELVLENRSNQKHIRWGLQSLLIKRNKLILNQEQLTLRGVRLTQLTTALSRSLRQGNVNLLLTPLSNEISTIAKLADQLGYYVIYEVNLEEDELLWHAESILFQHVSTLGFVLPQSAMMNPQLWHNAMLHLHRQRRDVYIGITVEEMPLSMVQGHVEFILTPVPFMPELAAVKMPALGLVRRFDLLAEELPINWAGRVSRVLPSE